MGGVIEGFTNTIGAGVKGSADQRAVDAQYRSAMKDTNYNEGLSVQLSQAAIGRRRAQGSLLGARQRLALSNSGIDAEVGTAADVQASNEVLTELDAMTLKNNAAREAWGFKTRKKQLAENWEQGLANANAEAITGIVKGQAKIISSAASMGMG